MEAEFFHVGGQTDRRDEPKSRFMLLCERAKNWNQN
jgi:hypothetical protein